MAITRGTNAGFVTTAPTANPNATSITIDNIARALVDTTPSGNQTVTEIGWWSATSSQAANYEVAIYDDSAAPINVVGTISTTNTKGTSIQWERVTGLNIALSGSTDYWIAIQLDNTATASQTDRTADGSSKQTALFGATQLNDPWGTYDEFISIFAFYAVIESATTGTNLQINISDVWKQVPAVQINIGDSWKSVVGMQLNIGDTWKSIF